MLKIQFNPEKDSLKSQHVFIKGDFYRNVVSSFQEEDWKHIQLQKQKLLGGCCLVKSLVVIPQQYNNCSITCLQIAEMYLDTSSGSHCKKRFIMPLNKARRFGEYN